MLQLRLVWNVWRYKDVTYGDTSSYYRDAANWAHTLHDNIVWSPLYTNYFGTVAFFIKDVPSAVAAHRLAIVLATTVLLLALMRALLGPALGLLIAVWWTVLPPNFNVQYEVHLFAVLPILAAAIVAVRWSGRNSRGVVLAILVGTTFLLRNEMAIASALFAGGLIVAELRARRRGVRVPTGAYLRAYALPLAVVLLLTAGAYWRSSVQGSQAVAAFHAKQDLNVCQIYAFTYQQRHPSRFAGNPFTSCGPLMQATFGRPLPSFLQATRADPGAMASFAGWNTRLLPNGLQVSLFGATSGGDDPDYFPVKLHRWYALALSVLTLLVVVAGGLAIHEQRPYWRREWLRGRMWALGVLASVSVTTLVVALTQRPRPEYLYGLTISLMVLVGLCGAALIRKAGTPRVVSLFAAALTLTLILAVGSHYHPGPRPLHDALERLSPVRTTLQTPGSVLAASSFNFQICSYLSETLSRQCTSPSWATLTGEVGGRSSLADVLDETGVSAIYADPQLHSDPALAPLLARPAEFGWRVVASGKSADGPWSVLVPAGSAAANAGGTPVALTHLPDDLGTAHLSYTGIFRDGWSRRVASVVLAGGPEGLLNLSAEVLALPNGRAQHLEVTVNGQPVASTAAAAGPLAVSARVPASHGDRRIELRWSATTGINPHDPRQSAALLQSIGVTAAGAPITIRFPGGLAALGPGAVGVFADGWVQQDSRFVLPGGPAGDLVLRADIPSFAGQHLAVRVNGRLAHSAAIGQEAFDLRVALPASPRVRRVQLHWSRASALGPNDPRRASARLEFVGIDSTPLPGGGRPPVVNNGGFENGLDGWVKIDTVQKGLAGTNTSTTQAQDSHSLRLVERSRNEDDYYSTVIAGLAPNTTYKISASAYVQSFGGAAIANRGLYGIARAGGTYDGPTQTSANITASTSGWVRKSISIKTGVSDDEIELRLYAPQGTTYWDAVGIGDRAHPLLASTPNPAFRAALSGRAEVPAPVGTSAGTAGTFTASLQDHILRWRLTLAELTGPPVAAVIRSAPPGQIGSRLISLCQPCTAPFSGTVTLTADQMRKLIGGPTYVNVGTPANPAGEVRGPIATLEPGRASG